MITKTTKKRLTRIAQDQRSASWTMDGKATRTIMQGQGIGRAAAGQTGQRTAPRTWQQQHGARLRVARRTWSRVAMHDQDGAQGKEAGG